MSDATDIWAVVPIKQFSRAKQRLSSAYTTSFRAGLARAMTEDVLAALAGVRELSGILVVTCDPAAAELAVRYGAVVSNDAADTGHLGAVSGAAQRLAREGRAGMLTMPGDVPLATSTEIASLIQGHPAAPAFSIVPAHDRRGSNAILCSPPDRVALRFGDDSFYPHLATAESSGIKPRVFRAAGIGLDIDNPQDLEALMKEPASGTRTWAFLASQKLVAPFAGVSKVTV